MKKLFVVLSLVLATGAVALAQKPVAGSKGFTFGLDNIFQNGSANITNTGPANTGTLLFRYYIADDMAARVSINYGKSSSKMTDTTGNDQESVTKTSSSTFGLSLGIQKSFGESEKLEPYVGADLFYAKTGGKFNYRQDITKASAGTVGDFVEVTANGTPNGGGYTGGSSSLGLKPLVGFNYYFSENFAIGAEFGWGLTLSSSDKKPVEQTVTVKSGATTTTTTTWYNSDIRTKGTNLGTSGNGKITVSVFF